jgi:hypothetical protein
MSRETLKEFLASVKGSSADSISYGDLSDENASGDRDRGDDLGIDPNTGEQLIQLSDSDRGLLGDYVNYIAKNYRGGNAYGISPGNKPPEDFNRGGSIQDAETTSNEDVFASQSTTLGQTLGSYSTSGIFTGTDEIIDKTAYNKDLSGHTLLNIEGENIDKTGQVDAQHIARDDSPHETKLKDLTYTMLQNNSRFAPGSSGVQYSNRRTETNNEIDDKEISKAQDRFGKYKKQGKSFIQSNLKSIGPSLLLKAAGLDIDTMNPDNFSNRNLSDNITSTINSRDLEAGNAYNSPVDRNERGAFDSSSAQQATTVHNVPGLEFQGENTSLNKKILKSFDELLTATLLDDKPNRTNKSVYTTNSYIDSVQHFLDVTIREKADLSNEDTAYFASMARLTLRLGDDASTDEESERSKIAQDEKIRKFLDVFAVLGDTDLSLYENAEGKEKERHWDVDQLTDGPATRISKNRSKNGFSTKSLAWRTNSMPSMYHMPMSIIRSVQKTGTVAKKNPVKAMLGSSIGDKTYLAQNLELDYSEGLGSAADGLWSSLTGDVKVDTSRARIPKAMVDIYEDMLDAEYVPFYFHDLRTNEIVAFHAFLTSLSDSFTASHTSYEGYGRMDDVLIYKNTKRSISGKFTLAATSKEDFDEMWFKVNKLVEMLYPQWSVGDPIESLDKKTKFVRPFSQIPTVSPMIRLRIGDVIRGNYSRFNLGRLFGSGDPNTYINAESILPTTLGSALTSWGGNSDMFNKITDVVNEIAIQVFMIAFGTPLQLLDLIPDGEAIGGGIKKMGYQIISNALNNGFVNPLVLDGINKLKNPDVDDTGGSGLFTEGYGPTEGNVVLLKPSQGKYRYITDGSAAMMTRIGTFKRSSEYNINTDKISDEESLDTDSSVQKVLIDRYLKCKIINKKQIDISIDPTKKIMRTYYNVAVSEVTASNDLFGSILTVAHEDIIVDPDWMFNRYFAWFLDPINNAVDLLQGMVDDLASSSGLMGDSIDLYTTTFEDFMSPYNNTITRSFEQSAGRGLAGFIGKLSYDLVGSNQNWELDHGSRAPVLLEISFDFKPVHDIAPGLDSNGFSRAPVYNVGSIMNNIAGDQQGEGRGSENRYNKAAMEAVKKVK